MNRAPTTPLFCKGKRGLAALAVLLTGLCTSGCSFNLASLTPGAEKDEPKSTASTTPQTRSPATRADPQESKAQVARGISLAQAGQRDDALMAFNTAIDLDPASSQGFYQRGLLYQSGKKCEFAIADFTSASGLTPLQVEPLLGRAQCFLALGKAEEAAADLDEASSVAPGNAQIWIARGNVYEKLGNRDKAADSFARAVLLRPNDDTARSGVTRNGGRAG
jgi:tetratricopeptide (TPR) repeat protein